MRNKETTLLYGEILEAVEYIENCKEFVSILPEVRTNLVYAASDAKTPDDVVGIDGRITVLNNMPYATGKPRFGASSHMARLILELMKVDPSIRAGINFVSIPVLEQWPVYVFNMIKTVFPDVIAQDFYGLCHERHGAGFSPLSG